MTFYIENNGVTNGVSLLEVVGYEDMLIDFLNQH